MTTAQDESGRKYGQVQERGAVRDESGRVRARQRSILSILESSLDLAFVPRRYAI